MPILTILNVPQEVHRAVKPEARIKLGSLLADVGRRARLTDEELKVFEQRDKTPAEPLDSR